MYRVPICRPYRRRITRHEALARGLFRNDEFPQTNLPLFERHNWSTIFMRLIRTLSWLEPHAPFEKDTISSSLAMPGKRTST